MRQLTEEDRELLNLGSVAEQGGRLQTYFTSVKIWSLPPTYQGDQKMKRNNKYKGRS